MISNFYNYYKEVYIYKKSLFNYGNLCPAGKHPSRIKNYKEVYILSATLVVEFKMHIIILGFYNI